MEDNIKMDLTETAMEGVNWMSVAQNRHNWRTLENTTTNLRIPQNARNFLSEGVCYFLKASALWSQQVKSYLALSPVVFAVLHHHRSRASP